MIIWSHNVAWQIYEATLRDAVVLKRHLTPFDLINNNMWDVCIDMLNETIIITNLFKQNAKVSNTKLK